MSRLKSLSLVIALSMVFVGCFTTTVTDLSLGMWGEDNSSGRDLIRGWGSLFVLSRTYANSPSGSFALSRFNPGTGKLNKGPTPGGWGFGLVDATPPYTDPEALGWVGWEPPTGGSSHTPTSVSVHAGSNRFFVTGSAVSPGGTAAAFSTINSTDGSLDINTSFSVSEWYNVGDAPGEDIRVVGSDVFVFGPAVVASGDNLLWVGKFDLSGNVDHSFGDACTIGNPPPCVSTGFLAVDTGFTFATYGDGAIDSGEAYIVARVGDSGTEGRIQVTHHDITNGTSKGILLTDGGPTDDYTPEALAIQPDGKILVAGYEGSGADTSMFIIRYTVLGARDATFGTGGKVTLDLSTGVDEIKDIAVLASDKIFVVGRTGPNGLTDGFSARYTETGVLDTTYSATGYQITTVTGVSNVTFNAVNTYSTPIATGNADDDIVLTYLEDQTP